MQKCSPLGYNLHGIAKLLNLGALLLFFVVLVYLISIAALGRFHWSLCWLLAVPCAVVIFSKAISMFGWNLAFKKGFKYDYEKREACWLESGQHVTYRWNEHDNKKQNKTKKKS